jgi:hypothetical protein
MPDREQPDRDPADLPLPEDSPARGVFDEDADDLPEPSEPG